jgi:hypothetical protein
MSAQAKMRDRHVFNDLAKDGLIPRGDLTQAFPDCRTDVVGYIQSAVWWR